jgi:siroheme synthase
MQGGAGPPAAMGASMRDRAKVHPVGAEPGDPELLTVRARKLITAAEVVICDHLIAPEITALVPAVPGEAGLGQA